MADGPGWLVTRGRLWQPAIRGPNLRLGWRPRRPPRGPPIHHCLRGRGCLCPLLHLPLTRLSQPPGPGHPKLIPQGTWHPGLAPPPPGPSPVRSDPVRTLRGRGCPGSLGSPYPKLCPPQAGALKRAGGRRRAGSRRREAAAERAALAGSAPAPYTALAAEPAAPAPGFERDI